MKLDRIIADDATKNMTTMTRVRATWKLPSAEWKALCDERGFTAGHDLPRHTAFWPLKRKLLDLGGWSVCIRSIDDDVKKIIERGVLVSGRRAISVKGAPSACHENSARLWYLGPHEATIMTGYALTRDGMWREHSWVYDIEGDFIVETTVRRIAYFGFVMTETEAPLFALQQGVLTLADVIAQQRTEVAS